MSIARQPLPKRTHIRKSPAIQSQPGHWLGAALLGVGAICSLPMAVWAASNALPEVTVSATEQEEDSYTSPETRSLGVSLPAQQTPATVNVVTDDFWEDSGNRNLDSVLTYIPGINMTDNGGWTGDAISIRGFSATLPFRDGMRTIASYGQSHRLMSETVERVEVLKGPAGNEFGVAEPGGAINIITKKPQREASSQVKVRTGEDGLRRVSTDITGAIGDNKNVQGRVIVGYEEPPEWRDGRPDDTQRSVFAPSVNWDYSDKGKALLAYERNYQNSPQDRGIIYLEGAWPGGFAPREWSFHQEISEQINETERFTLTVDHQLSDALTSRTMLEYQTLHYQLNEFRNAESEPGWGPLYEEDGLTWTGATEIPLLWASWEGDGSSNSVQSSLDYVMPMGSAVHTLSAGVRGYRFIIDNAYLSINNSNTFDIFNGTHNQYPLYTSVDGIYTDEQIIEEYGVFTRWLGEWTSRFRTIVGVQSFDYEYQYDGYNNGVADYFDTNGANELSWRLAASYDLTSRNTLFAGVSDGYVPQSGLKRSGDDVSPIRDTAVEAGLKTSLVPDRLTWTNTVYQIKREEISADDPANLGEDPFVVNAGSAEIQGIESELVGRITENLQVRGGVALMTSELVDNPVADFNGNEFANTPEQQVSGQVSYRWAAAGLDRLKTTLGVTHIGERYGNSGNTVTLPDYTLVDASAAWALAPKTEISLAASNLLDETYYTGMQDGNGNGADQVMVGDKRNVSVGIKHQF